MNSFASIRGKNDISSKGEFFTTDAVQCNKTKFYSRKIKFDTFSGGAVLIITFYFSVYFDLMFEGISFVCIR